MKRQMTVAVVVAVAVLSGCQADERVFSPTRKPGEGTSGKYPTGNVPPAGLLNPGDQRSFDPSNSDRGLELRADWATTGRKAPGERGPVPTMPFGAQGAEHNGPEDVDRRAPEPSPLHAPTMRDEPKHDAVPSPRGANPSGAPPHH
jgi:hypothetical protein